MSLVFWQLICHLCVAPCEMWGGLFGCVGSGEVDSV